MMKREHVPIVVSGLIGGRPVRWAPTERLVGDYDGRERTLEIFNADVPEQRPILEAVDRERLRLEKAAGGPLVLVFHSVKQSKTRHQEFLTFFESLFPVIEALPAPALVPWCPDEPGSRTDDPTPQQTPFPPKCPLRDGDEK